MSQDDSSTLQLNVQTGNPAKWCPQSNIPTNLLRWKGLCAGAKVVYAALLNLAAPGSETTTSIQVVATYAGLGYDQTQKHLKTLQSVGLIVKKQRFQQTCVIHLKPHPILQGQYGPNTPISIVLELQKRTLVRTKKDKTISYSSTNLEEKAKSVQTYTSGVPTPTPDMPQIPLWDGLSLNEIMWVRRRNPDAWRTLTASVQEAISLRMEP
jgi:hypothetical protein